MTCHGLSHQQLDVTDRDSVLALDDEGYDAIVHCAGEVNADLCETERDHCERTHVQGTKNILTLAERCGAKVLYPQSFLIFDGSDQPVTESTRPNPLSWYSTCKLAAANAVREASESHLIIQMGGFFGGDEKDKNFVGKFVPHVIKQIKNGQTGMSVGDRIWQPTYTHDLARNCMHLLSAGNTGIYNMASHGAASFYELAVECVHQLGLSDRFKITEVPAADVAGTEPARRPDRLIMTNARMQVEGLDLQRPWKEALAEYLKRPYFQKMIECL